MKPSSSPDGFQSEGRGGGNSRINSRKERQQREGNTGASLVERNKEEEEQGRKEGLVRVEPGAEIVGSIGAKIVGRKGGRVL
jgi:hypothetical protein